MGARRGGVLEAASCPTTSRRARSWRALRHTPGNTTIAVFRRLGDFSVRSVGFEGFPALGVCFGPVVTAVSPLSRLRGSFSWARTGFHEFSHVVHLGLSNNRCPRWITEGLATWEEVARNPTWTRNMRRDLVDAHANGNLIPLRELNRAFRGPRILFGYYQGGLLCRMLIDEHGFQPMVQLLMAFDLGATSTRPSAACSTRRRRRSTRTSSASWRPRSMDSASSRAGARAWRGACRSASLPLLPQGVQPRRPGPRNGARWRTRPGSRVGVWTPSVRSRSCGPGSAHCPPGRSSSRARSRSVRAGRTARGASGRRPSRPEASSTARWWALPARAQQGTDEARLDEAQGSSSEPSRSSPA